MPSLVLLAGRASTASTALEAELLADATRLVGIGGFDDATVLERLDTTAPRPLGVPGRYVTLLRSETRAVAPARPPHGFRATFDEIFRQSAGDAPLDLATATGVFLVLVDNLAVDDEAGFNAWYDRTHATEVLEAAKWRGIYRYRRTDDETGAPRYLAMYEGHWDDPRRHAELSAAASPSMVAWPHIQQFHVALYRLVGHRQAPA